jgi:hypothetical protein
MEHSRGTTTHVGSTIRFLVNSQAFGASAPPYAMCFFQLMCHELFEGMKNDHNKSAIHYSANKTTRSVYFDVGTNEENWLFELGPRKEVGPIPLWVVRLLGFVMKPHVGPATFLRRLLFFKGTLDSVFSAFCSRFLSIDFANFICRRAHSKAVIQVESIYLNIPYLAFVDQWRVSMTETPNELRCIPYTTDGRGFSPALSKWCDTAFATLFLGMAERVTRSLGFVFKHKSQYGTAVIGPKKIKFHPRIGSDEVDVTITAQNSFRTCWSKIPGTDHIVRMCVVLFRDLSGEAL